MMCVEAAESRAVVSKTHSNSSAMLYANSHIGDKNNKKFWEELVRLLEHNLMELN
jgi:hypothetical protein